MARKQVEWKWNDPLPYGFVLIDLQDSEINYFNDIEEHLFKVHDEDFRWISFSVLGRETLMYQLHNILNMNDQHKKEELKNFACKVNHILITFHSQINTLLKKLEKILEFPRKWIDHVILLRAKRISERYKTFLKNISDLCSLQNINCPCTENQEEKEEKEEKEKKEDRSRIYISPSSSSSFSEQNEKQGEEEKKGDSSLSTSSSWKSDFSPETLDSSISTLSDSSISTLSDSQFSVSDSLISRLPKSSKPSKGQTLNKIPMRPTTRQTSSRPSFFKHAGNKYEIPMRPTRPTTPKGQTSHPKTRQVKNERR